MVLILFPFYGRFVSCCFVFECPPPPRYPFQMIALLSQRRTCLNALWGRGDGDDSCSAIGLTSLKHVPGLVINIHFLRISTSCGREACDRDILNAPPFVT